MKEIEIKALLSESKYNQLREYLPSKFKQIEKDSITTFRFRPKDIRVRYSDKINELVFKDGDPTHFSREEVTINLGSRDDSERMILLLKELGYKDDPSWVKHKDEFIIEHDGVEYTLSLQHIERFAYLLEAEIITDEENAEKHVPKLKQVLTSLGCEPIEAEEFKEKIKKYIETFSK